MLDQLPTEIAREIFKQVDNSRDWKALCQVSRSTYHQAAPLLFEAVVLRHDEPSLGRESERISCLNQFGPPSFLQHTRHLRVVSPFREYVGDYRCPHFHRLDGDFASEEEHFLLNSSGTEPVSNILALLCHLRSGALRSFSWEMGTCVAAGLFWPLGYLAQEQRSVESINLITDASCAACLDYGNPVVLDSFRNIRKLSWTGLRSPQDMRALRHSLVRSSDILADLRLDAVRYHHDWSSKDNRGDEAGGRNVLVDCILPGPAARPFPVLRVLCLGALPLWPATTDLVEALCGPRLRSLTLRACPGWSHFLRSWILSGRDVHLASLEVQVPADMRAGSRPEVWLSIFLRHFCGLEELAISIPGLLDRPTTLWHAALTHSTLKKFVYHVRMFELDLDSLHVEDETGGETPWTTESVQLPSPSSGAPPNLECLGLTCLPAYLQLLVGSLKRQTSLKILHVRQSGRDILRYDSWGLRTVESGEDLDPYDEFPRDPTRRPEPPSLPGLQHMVFSVPEDAGRGPRGHTDVRHVPFPCRILQPEFQRFATWAFGPEGISSLQVLAFGDFSCRGRYQHLSFMLGKEDGKENDARFRLIDLEQEHDGRFGRLVRESWDFFEACPSEPLLHVRDRLY